LDRLRAWSRCPRGFASLVTVLGLSAATVYVPPLGPPRPLEPGVQVAVTPAWGEVVELLGAEFDPTSHNPCNRGDRTCLGLIVDEMTARFEPLAKVCSHRAAFAFMYLRVTEGVDADATEFHDPAYLTYLDAVFAKLYFQASDGWQAGKLDSVPEAWRIAFEVADRGHVNGLGDMLLGMNAHISRDLPFALAEAGLSGSSGRYARRDFEDVNALLGQVQLPLVREAAAMFDQAIATVTAPVLNVAANPIAWFIGLWRAEAWNNAERLLAATGADRDEVVADIERAAASRARWIRMVTSHLPFLGSSHNRARYEHCRSQQESDRRAPFTTP
jgi:hypothetical protein